MIENKIKKILTKKIKDSKIFIQDMTGNDDHFNVIIISKKFQGLSLIERHKIIYNILEPMVTKEIHALQLKTITREEWEKQN